MNLIGMFYEAVLLIVAIAICTAVVLFLWRKYFHKRPSDRTLASDFKTTSKKIPERELSRMMEGNAVNMGIDTATGQISPLPDRARNLNVINVGPVNSGKTAYFVSTFIAADLSCKDKSVVIFDGQGDITDIALAHAKKQGWEMVIYPDEGFNPLKASGDAFEYAEAFADLLPQVLDVSNEGASQYYLHQQQNFVRKVIPLYLKAYHQPMIIRELLYLCRSEQARKRLLADASPSAEASDYALFFGDWKKADFDNNLSGLVNFIDRLCVGKYANLFNERDAPTLKDHIDNKRVIIIREGGARGTQAGTRGLFYMVGLQEYAKDRDMSKSSHLVSIYIDEAHQYFNSNYPNFIATARKKRIAQHLGFQNFDQLGEYAEVILTNARTWVIHGGLLHKDAVLVADQIGMREYLLRSTSETGAGNGSVSYHPVYDYLVKPHEIRGLSEDLLLVLTVEGRETSAHKLLKKPEIPYIPTTHYVERQVKPYPPLTYWEYQPEPTEGGRRQVEKMREVVEGEEPGW